MFGVKCYKICLISKRPFFAVRCFGTPNIHFFSFCNHHGSQREFSSSSWDCICRRTKHYGLQACALRAYACVPGQTPAFVYIPSEHHHLGPGYSYPLLTNWFSGYKYVANCLVEVKDDTFHAYFAWMNRHASLNRGTCSLVLMRQSKTGNYLVNLRSTDSALAKRAVRK
jgi:hypothetical protein